MIYSYATAHLVFDAHGYPRISLSVTAALYEAVCAAVDQYGDRVHAHLHEGLRHGLWTLQRDQAATLARDAEPPVHVDAGSPPGEA
jgi:cytosine/adenosine deaminase-related metal-dependent hydrolase